MKKGQVNFSALIKEAPKRDDERWIDYYARIINYLPENYKLNTLTAGYTRAIERVKKENDEEADYAPINSREFEENDDGTASIKMTLEDKIVKTKEEAIALSKVDLDKWIVTGCKIKHWSTTMKVKTVLREDGVKVKKGVSFNRNKVISTETPFVVQNSGIQLSLSPKTSFAADFRASMLDCIPIPLPVPKRHGIAPKKRLLVEPCIFDLHLGKTAFDPVKGVIKWSLDEARYHYREAINAGLENVNLDHVTKFSLCVGNDMLHIDGTNGATTSGTVVGDGGLYFTLYDYTLNLVADTAMELAQIAPVELIGMPGNHDFDSILSLVCAWKRIFAGHGDVKVADRGINRHYLRHGVSALGYHHGDRITPAKIKDAMYAECPWIGETPLKYIKLGHLHTSIKKDFIVRDTVKEEFGVEVEYVSSLCPTDHWHDKNLYIGNARKAKTFIYDYDKGMVGQSIYNILK